MASARVIVCFVIARVCAALREELLSRQSALASMVTGVRTLRD
jgi:Ni,Fe-hydrogenase I cytochrome b subunit